MTKTEYLFACLSEEAGEIVQSVGKIHRFGLQDSNPDKATAANDILLGHEINDMLAIVEMLAEECHIAIPGVYDRKHIEAKKAKVRKYYPYSIKRGALTAPW